MGSSQPSADDEVTEAVELGRPDREELQPGAIVGRYVVVARVGAGGMGVVYLARDPDLDRNVALKLLMPTHERGRALREAQALAKLSHPNVVTVFDVGVRGERVWLAMEFVEGTTLAQWLRERDRDWRAVLPVLLAAGDGLAAAHDVKLVHRDVKPDNIMVAKGDGDALRVLVTDFGLAREIVEDPAATPVRGTPAYMAPERHRAGSVDAKVDQFGWCVTAWEALFGERPFEGAHPGALLLAVTRREIRAPQRPDAVPRWLRRALERGLDPDPTKRWPSLGELLLHVRRTSTRGRRRVIAAFAVLATAAVVAIPTARYVQASRTRAQCIADVGAIDRLWPGEAKPTIDAALRSTGLTFAAATADRVVVRVDDWVDEWRTIAHAQCDADEREPALREAASACLAQRRASLAALLDRLATPDLAIVRSAVSATAGLPRATDCTDASALARRPRPAPADAERVADVSAMIDRVRAETSGASAADDAVAAARTIGWPPLVADALTARARLADGDGDASGAARMLEEAYAIATAANADDQAFAAAIALMNVIGMSQARPADGMTWAMHADALLARRVPPDRLAAATLDLSRARLHQELGEYELAIPEIERAVAVRRELLGDDHPELATAQNLLGWAHYRSGRSAKATELFHSALSIYERAFGREHPACALPLLNLGNVAWQRNEVDEAADHYARAYEILRAALGESHVDVSAPLMNLGAVAFARNRYDEAADRFARAAEIKSIARGPDHPDTLAARGNLATALHMTRRSEDAELVLDDVIDRLVATRGADHIDTARALMQRGRVRQDRWERTALADFEGAVVVIERAVGPEHREVGEVSALFGLALARWSDPQQADARCRLAIASDERVAGTSSGLEAYVGSAVLAAARGDRATTIAFAEQAIAKGTRHDVPSFMLAEPRLLLARALWPSDRVRARAEAERARDDALAEPLREAALLWLAEHR